MKCPNCNETLLMTHRNNIEIDYCPTCRGIWLDRGELDKLLEQEARAGSSEQSAGKEQYKPDDRPHGRYDERHQYPKKKKSFLGDFFDFD